MAGWIEGDVDRGGAPLHFHRTGDGSKPPLVLSHGFSDNGRCWTRFARAMESDFDIVMVDARNHGRSARGPATPDDLVADLAAVISGLGLDGTALVGHSIGARTAAGVAAIHPELVSRLVLEDPPWTTGGKEDPEAAQRRADGVRAYIGSLASMTDDELLAMGTTQHADWHADEFPDWTAAKRQLGEEAATSLTAQPWEPTVAAIACPTLLVHGEAERGGMVTAAVADQIAAMNDHVQVRCIAGAGHNIRREQFEAFVETVAAFLR